MLSRALQDTFSEFGNSFDGGEGSDIFSLGMGDGGSPFAFPAAQNGEDDMVL
jgi:hypothetical protein